VDCVIHALERITVGGPDKDTAQIDLTTEMTP
jgi:hypothetical protein